MVVIIIDWFVERTPSVFEVLLATHNLRTNASSLEPALYFSLHFRVTKKTARSSRSPPFIREADYQMTGQNISIRHFQTNSYFNFPQNLGSVGIYAEIKGKWPTNVIFAAGRRNTVCSDPRWSLKTRNGVPIRVPRKICNGKSKLGPWDMYLGDGQLSN